jgi:hypothetical protein
MHRLHRENVEVLPARIRLALQDVPAALFDGAISPALLVAGRRPDHDRLDQSFATKPDVSQPLVAVAGNHQHHVGARTHRTVRPITHPRLAGRDGKSCGRQRQLEQAVLLKAVAAAPAIHQCRLQRLRIEGDHLPHLDIEIFERDGADVRTVPRPQGWQIGLNRPFETDPLQISRKIERHD